jgi:hypothetical protein
MSSVITFWSGSGDMVRLAGLSGHFISYHVIFQCGGLKHMQVIVEAGFEKMDEEKTLCSAIVNYIFDNC